MTIRTMYQKTGLTALQTVVIGGAASVSLCVGGIIIQETQQAQAESVTVQQEAGLGSASDPNLAPEPTAPAPPVDPANVPAPEPPPVDAAPPAPKQSVPLDNNIIAGEFGYRYGVNPLLDPSVPELHNGIDFAAPMGAGIHSVKPGVVEYAEYHVWGGNRTIIDHQDGTKSTYNHQEGIFVTVGDSIEKGQLIGSVGSTGNSTGPHLHFEYIWNGEDVDPAPLLDEFNN